MNLNQTKNRLLEVRDDTADKARATDPDIGDQKEIVAHGAFFHLERMADDCVWIGLQVGKRFLHINLYAIKKGFVGMHVEEEEHDDRG